MVPNGDAPSLLPRPAAWYEDNKKKNAIRIVLHNVATEIHLYALLALLTQNCQSAIGIRRSKMWCLLKVRRARDILLSGH